jgi:hypothetical protein
MRKWYKKTDIIFLFAGLISLLALSCVFAKERIIYTDTACYLDIMIGNGGFYVATNRFISLFSQVLPALGIALAIPLKWVLYMYSLNFILIPIISAVFCLLAFKDKATALAILFFYILMSRWVFYYPVSEFQMGLCFLLVYHSFLNYFFQNGQRRLWLFYIFSLIMTVIIIFSHPLSFYVFFAWLVWLLLDYPACRKWLLACPAMVALISWYGRDHFFKAWVGYLAYDDKKKEGLQNFHQPVSHYFNSELSRTFFKALTEHYFVILFLFVALIIWFLWKRKWLQALFFTGIVLSFWLLVTVSFKDWPYQHYVEHLYQPLPFFTALVFGKYIFQIIRQPRIRFVFLAVISVILFAKISDNHVHFTQRLKWYQNYIGLMHKKNIHKAALEPYYIISETPPDYWASKSESLLLSSLPGPDSSAIILINWNKESLNKNLENSNDFNGNYFHLNNKEPYIILDSVASPETLNQLKWDAVVKY